jgi:hypothetical protein
MIINMRVMLFRLWRDLPTDMINRATVSGCKKITCDRLSVWRDGKRGSENVSPLSGNLTWVSVRWVRFVWVVKALKRWDNAAGTICHGHGNYELDLGLMFI